MSSSEASTEPATGTPGGGTLDTKLEVVVVPVSDVDRAKDFYGGLGWRLDADVVAGDDVRLIQFTPPGSSCSIQFGTNLTSAAPGSARGLYLAVSDIEAARDQLVARHVEVSEVFHEGEPGSAVRVRDQPSRQRPRTRSRQLRLVRVVQRSRRQRLVGAGGHQPAAWAGRPGHYVVRVRERSGSRPGARAARPTASTRSASVKRTPTGRTGTPEYMVAEHAGEELPS